MTTVKQLLQEKGPNVWTISPDRSVQDALKLMADKNIGALLVLEAEELVGIFSERDFARLVARKEKLSLDTPVSEIMTKKVICVRAEQTIEECMALMTDKHIRHLPVLVDNQLAGVISIGDVVKAIISHQEFIIAQLENYIVGKG
jgi:CBS domain-containing protein